MAQYIDKAALVAEIEKRKKEAESNCGGYKSYEEHRCNRCTVGFYKEFLEIINTLEVKEVDSNDALIDKACEWLENNFINECGYLAYGSAIIHFNTKSAIEKFKQSMKGE